MVAIGATASGGFQTTVQPYAVGIAEGYETEPLFSVGDTVPEASDPSKSYQMVGIPDGLAHIKHTVAGQPLHESRAHPGEHLL